MSKKENNMWNFDELFAEGNVIGLGSIYDTYVFINVVEDKRKWHKENIVNWNDFQNNNLANKQTNERIEYIVKLDRYGNSTILFNREKDMLNPMPELKSGMFVDVIIGDNYISPIHGYVDTNNNRIIYQNGDFDYIDRLINGSYAKIIKVYSDSAYCYNQCISYNIKWIDNDYKKYLENK